MMQHNLTPSGCVRTRTGLVIGGAFIKPKTDQGSQAEKIQDVLLRFERGRRVRRAKRTMRVLWRWLCSERAL